MRTLMIVDMADQEMMSAHPQQLQHSGWHSPVPYLFGGLAAMLGLIAFALLILACSYWKLSGYLQGARNRVDGSDVENGGGKPLEAAVKFETLWEEKIVVIMAGDERPTFLATPVSSRAFSFNENNADKKNKGVDVDSEDDDDNNNNNNNNNSDKRVDECHQMVDADPEEEHSYKERIEASKRSQAQAKS